MLVISYGMFGDADNSDWTICDFSDLGTDRFCDFGDFGSDVWRC